jgi:hypothetical protein
MQAIASSFWPARFGDRSTGGLLACQPFRLGHQLLIEVLLLEPLLKRHAGCEKERRRERVESKPQELSERSLSPYSSP